jgi:uncharacterized protein with PIN domain
MIELKGHARERGHPGRVRLYRGPWVPAFAGMTPIRSASAVICDCPDTSAIITAIAVEPDGVRYRTAIQSAISLAVVPLDAELAHAAFDAFRRYGKGQGRPAQLNIVDCVVYAQAKRRDDPLLFKGDDFTRTDIAPAI